MSDGEASGLNGSPQFAGGDEAAAFRAIGPGQRIAGLACRASSDVPGTCGNITVPVLTCPHCHGEVAPANTHSQPGPGSGQVLAEEDR